MDKGNSFGSHVPKVIKNSIWHAKADVIAQNSINAVSATSIINTADVIQQWSVEVKWSKVQIHVLTFKFSIYWEPEGVTLPNINLQTCTPLSARILSSEAWNATFCCQF